MPSLRCISREKLSPKSGQILKGDPREMLLVGVVGDAALNDTLSYAIDNRPPSCEYRARRTGRREAPQTTFELEKEEIAEAVPRGSTIN